MSEPKTKSIGTKVAPSVYDTLQQIAAVQRRTVADVVREMIDESLARWADSVGSYDPTDVMAKLAELEAKIDRGAEAVATVGSYDPDVMVKLLELEAKVDRGAEAACEGRYFARLAAMYGMDVAHYVGQKTEPGKVPEPPDKDEKQKKLAMYERKSREFTELYLKGKGNEEAT